MAGQIQTKTYADAKSLKDIRAARGVKKEQAAEKLKQAEALLLVDRFDRLEQNFVAREASSKDLAPEDNQRVVLDKTKTRTLLGGAAVHIANSLTLGLVGMVADMVFPNQEITGVRIANEGGKTDSLEAEVKQVHTSFPPGYFEGTGSASETFRISTSEDGSKLYEYRKSGSRNDSSKKLRERNGVLTFID